MIRLLQGAAVLCWITITVLSLVPAAVRPHTGASGNTEHFLAYVIAALITRVAFARPESRWQLAAFSAASAIFEICQIWIPGRAAGVGNWAASTAGALAGIGVAMWIAKGNRPFGPMNHESGGQSRRR